MGTIGVFNIIGDPLGDIPIDAIDITWLREFRPVACLI
jgi:hypothetical protein